MRNFYTKLLKEFALQGYEHVDIDETILAVYERVMTAYLRDAEGVPADRLVELRYDELDADPLAAVAWVYEQLSLPGFDAACGRFEAYLASVSAFEKNRFDYSDEAAAKVEARLRPFIERWDYKRPGRPAAAAESGETDEGARHGENAA
jgi:hypothetical protein